MITPDKHEAMLLQYCFSEKIVKVRFIVFYIYS